MNFADNLHHLRKRDRVTQEELAEQLGVSRQSVSKWETGEAYPETDKLILLSDFFHVSLDDLIRSDLTNSQQPLSPPEPSADEREGYVAHMNKFSVRIALGVFLILFGVGICVALNGYAMMFTERANELLSIFGAIAVILFVALSVFLFVVAGIGHEHYQKEHTEIPTVYSETQLHTFEKRFAVSMAGLIAGILLDVVLLVVLSALIETGILTAIPPDSAECFVVAAFLTILGFLVGGIVYLGIQYSKYHVEEYNREVREGRNPSKGQKIKDGICGIIMLTATAVFLLIGFVWNVWHPSWVVFPIGGILCGIVSTIFNAKK